MPFVDNSNDRLADCAEQDQTASMCRLIVLYTIHRINSSPRTVDYLFTKRQHFRFVQIQSICRRQINSDSKFEIYVGKSSKQCGEKRRKCWLPAFSPFPTMFSEAFFSSDVKSRNCVAKN